MFFQATSFNQDLSYWDVSNVGDMSYMFSGAYDFDGDVSSWTPYSVYDMSYMFEASGFSGQYSINSWQYNLPSGVNMDYMFSYADFYDDDLSDWDMSSIADYCCYIDDGASSWDSMNKPDFSSCQSSC
jgi:surface protein